MADYNCKACDDLREDAPNFITNGLSETACNSLKNDTGLRQSNDNNDCTDLENAIDCLVGNMAEEVEVKDVCDWRDFTKDFIGNLHQVLKAMNCAICGLWTNVHSLWAYVRSFQLKKSGNKIYLEASDGRHGEVIDADTTYELTRSGHTIHLRGSDGSDDSVTMPDDNTTYTLTRNGHTIHLVGSDGTDDSTTIPDNDTWQKNTSTQDGYVTKGEDDPLKVWCTNDDGIPGWRNSPTLGGHLTLMNHDGWIGETKYWELSQTRSIADDTEVKIETVTLTKGTWIIAATIGYDLNANGVRALGISFGNATHRKGVMLPACDAQHETILCKTYIHKVESDTEKVYIDAYQTSGGALNLMIAPETYVNCIRIE